MPTQRKIWTISLPPRLEKEVARLARKEEKNKSELIREALRMYLQKRKNNRSVFK